MRSIIRKSILIGIGAAELAQEQAAKHLQELAKKKKITQKELRPYLKKMMRETVKGALTISRLAEKELYNTLRKGKMVSGKELSRIKRRIEGVAKELEKKGRKSVKKW